MVVLLKSIDLSRNDNLSSRSMLYSSISLQLAVTSFKGCMWPDIISTVAIRRKTEKKLPATKSLPSRYVAFAAFQQFKIVFGVIVLAEEQRTTGSVDLDDAIGSAMPWIARAHGRSGKGMVPSQPFFISMDVLPRKKVVAVKLWVRVWVLSKETVD